MRRLAGFDLRRHSASGRRGPRADLAVNGPAFLTEAQFEPICALALSVEAMTRRAPESANAMRIPHEDLQACILRLAATGH
jgi:hypothetical protein